MIGFVRGELPPPESPALRKAAQEIVGRTFYGTLLAQARQSSLKTGLMDGGRMEEAFGAQLDAIYAESLGAWEKRGLGEALYRRLVDQQIRIDASLCRKGNETGA